jgi:ComF family protein
VRTLKFDRRAGVSRPLGSLVAQSVLAAAVAAEIVTHVPLSRRRERERGFDQAEAIAHEAAVALALPFGSGALRRCRDTRPQGTLGAAARRTNVAGAFEPTEAAHRRFSGRTVLLVDDVVTTGSTLASCAAAIRRAGARSVVGASVAVARAGLDRSAGEGTGVASPGVASRTDPAETRPPSTADVDQAPVSLPPPLAWSRSSVMSFTKSSIERL